MRNREQMKWALLTVSPHCLKKFSRFEHRKNEPCWTSEVFLSGWYKAGNVKRPGQVDFTGQCTGEKEDTQRKLWSSAEDYYHVFSWEVKLHMRKLTETEKRDTQRILANSTQNFCRIGNYSYYSQIRKSHNSWDNGSVMRKDLAQ